MKPLLEDIRQALATSELLLVLTSMQASSGSLVPGDDARPLTDEEISRLESQGNSAEDWSCLRVSGSFRTEHVRNNLFLGTVILGCFDGSMRDLGDGCMLPTGVHASTVADSEIGDNALVHRVGLLRRTRLQPGASVAHCRSMTCKGDTTYGCGEELPLAIETGGRDIRSFGDMTIRMAEVLATNRGDAALLDAFNALIDEHLDAIRGKWTIISTGAIVRDTGHVGECYAGPAATIVNATSVSNACLLSSPDEPTSVRDGAIVRHAILQWGSDVGSMAIVDTSVLCEHSHVERHGKLTQSILGPNSGLGEGEITASLVGPFVGFHHQSLLISAMWPEGKGNIGYGANVGSNHTGRAPDQEIWCGEGTFFGLGCNIKFPTDLTCSPYSIIATGVTCLPQRVEFPFSLINTSSATIDNLSPAFNEIFPGWVLADNLYMLKRNEAKYRSRNKARRNVFEFDVFRPSVLDLMVDARGRLAAVGDQKVYTSRDIPGLGKNYLTEASRCRALEVYDFQIGLYARLGLLAEIRRQDLTVSSPEAASLLADVSGEEAWEHCRLLLTGEGDATDIPALLKDLIERERTVAKNVEDSKARDDIRGSRIIDDYADAHAPASEDAFIQDTWQSCDTLAEEIRILLEG